MHRLLEVADVIRTAPCIAGRYADLVWDLCRTVTGNNPPIDAARIAISGYVDSIVEGRCEHFDGTGDIAEGLTYCSVDQ